MSSRVLVVGQGARTAFALEPHSARRSGLKLVFKNRFERRSKISTSISERPERSIPLLRRRA